MTTGITPLLSVKDIQVNTDYFVKTLGFKLDFVTGDGTTAILNYRGALLMLQADGGDEPPALADNLTELQVRVGNIEEIYASALSRGAIIRRYLECTTHKDGTVARHFTVSLPDGYPLTFIKDGES